MVIGYSGFVMHVYGRLLRIILIALIGSVVAVAAHAQDQAPADFTPAELEELVGPVALYPDTLLAIVLPAASYPLQIVEAARYLEALDANPDLSPDEDWDDAIVALLNYPEIIALMNEDLDWTWNLGAAVVHQQPDVLAAVQSFRGRAVAAGNLQTDDRQTVSRVDDVIEVTPVDSEVIYVPYYEPSRVVVYQRQPVYYYYPRSYPLYYYPYPVSYSFSNGFFWGVTTAYTVGWLTHRVHFHHIGYASHPYYGRRYVDRYRARHARRVRHRQAGLPMRRGASQRSPFGTAWRPGDRHGVTPRHRTKNRVQLRRELTQRRGSLSFNDTGARLRRDGLRGTRTAPGGDGRRSTDGARTRLQPNRGKQAERRVKPRRQPAANPRLTDGRVGRKAGRHDGRRMTADARPSRREPAAKPPRADRRVSSPPAPARQERRQARDAARAAGRVGSGPRADQVRGGPSGRRNRR